MPITRERRMASLVDTVTGMNIVPKVKNRLRFHQEKGTKRKEGESGSTTTRTTTSTSTTRLMGQSGSSIIFLLLYLVLIVADIGETFFISFLIKKMPEMLLDFFCVLSENFLDIY